MKLQEIQQKLKAAKNQYNKFGQYHYRSCEDILEAVKPLLGDSTLILSDTTKEVGGMVYVEATAIFNDGQETRVTSCAGVEHQKGMTLAQCFGASSSYARKYALNGLFLIDDTKDGDTNKTPKNEPKAEFTYPEIGNANTEEELKKIWNEKPELQTNKVFSNEVAKRKKQLGL